MGVNERERIQKIAQMFDGKIVAEESVTGRDFFSRPLSADQRKLLFQFSSLRHFVQIGRLADELGFGREFFRLARQSVAQLRSYLPLDERQTVLFALLYLHSKDEGSAVAVKTIAEDLHISAAQLVKAVDCQDMQEKGLLLSEGSGDRRTFRIPRRVMEAVAVVDMVFYLGVLDKEAFAPVTEKEVLFALIAREP